MGRVLRCAKHNLALPHFAHFFSSTSRRLLNVLLGLNNSNRSALRFTLLRFAPLESVKRKSVTNVMLPSSDTFRAQV